MKTSFKLESLRSNEMEIVHKADMTPQRGWFVRYVFVKEVDTQSEFGGFSSKFRLSRRVVSYTGIFITIGRTYRTR